MENAERKYISYTYERSTKIIKEKIALIRELREFLYDNCSRKYPYVCAMVGLEIASHKSEIRQLLKLRRQERRLKSQLDE